MLLVKWKLCAATWLKFCNRQEDLGQVYRWDKEMRQNTLFASPTCKDTDTATETQISGAIKTSPTARGSGIEKWLLLHPSSTVPSKSPAPDDFRSRWKDKPELEDVSIKDKLPGSLQKLLDDTPWPGTLRRPVWMQFCKLHRLLHVVVGSLLS